MISEGQRDAQNDVFARLLGTFNVVAHAELQRQQVSPYLQVMESGSGSTDIIEGTPRLNFATNDYLGLRRDPRVIEASISATRAYGSGLSASRLMCGNIPLHSKVEEQLSELLQQESALLFTTGYDANLGSISALLTGESTALCERGVHASIIDGCRLGGARIRQFRSGTDELRRKVEATDTTNAVIISESIFSMEGTQTDLDDLTAVASENGIPLILDEAHSAGVLGAGGIGLAGEHVNGRSVDLITGTLSKAFASCGGFVAGRKELVDALRVSARSSMFTAGANPASLGAATAAIEIASAEEWRRTRLAESSNWLRTALTDQGIKLVAGDSQIIGVMIGDTFEALQKARELFDNELNVGVAVHPAVAKDKALLRICVSASHTNEELERCADTLTRIVATAAA